VPAPAEAPGGGGDAAAVAWFLLGQRTLKLVVAFACRFFLPPLYCEESVIGRRSVS
jgi:hypothetical protein